jgi:hypothetical protein
MTWQQTSHNPEVAVSNPALRCSRALQAGALCFVVINERPVFYLGVSPGT